MLVSWLIQFYIFYKRKSILYNNILVQVHVVDRTILIYLLIIVFLMLIYLFLLII